ncbi:hypothetical protein ACFL9S_22590 [Erwinia sp. AnSW2-5]|uniref:hypothetical protein n=1 Tax=Erwinia sp. AnSW2-5 TaxID=3367692 RepID=UPI003859F2F8
MAEVVYYLFVRWPEFFTGINLINIGDVLQRLSCRRDMNGRDRSGLAWPGLAVRGNKQDQ